MMMAFWEKQLSLQQKTTLIKAQELGSVLQNPLWFEYPLICGFYLQENT
jgi:hypothetical protein